MTCLINGTEYQLQADFEISEQLGNTITSTMTVLVEHQPFPKSGDIVQIIDDSGECIWYGTCGIPSSPEYSTLEQPKLYGLTCQNANGILSNRIANIAMQNATITEIVQTLFNSYISAEGITLGKISEIPATFQVYTAADYNLRDALDELANTVQAVWQITPDKKFYFVVSDDFPAFPEVLSTSFLFGGGYKMETKDYLMRTVQIISGATDTTDPQTESFIYQQDQTSFTTVFPFATKPTITVNGDGVSSALIGVNGIDDNNENIVFSFSYDSQILSYKESSGYLSVGDKVVVTYSGLYRIRVTAQNEDKISEIAAASGTSGMIEQVQLANNITTTSDASQLANSLLERFAEARQEMTFWVLTTELQALGMSISDLAVGTRFSVDLPEIGMSGDFVISERTITPLAIVESGADYVISLKLVDRDSLKSYGQIISDLRKDINQLSIRPDDIVIDTRNFIETEADSETTDWGLSLVYFPTADAGVVNGSLFSPLDLGVEVFPM